VQDRAVFDRMISADSHIIEPPNLWARRLPADLRERGPQLRREAATPGRRSKEAEVDRWYVDGQNTGYSFGYADKAGLRFLEDPALVPLEGQMDAEGEGGGLAPDLFLKECEDDHVIGSVLYPTFAHRTFTATSDLNLVAAMARAYNDHLAEFCSYAPARLKGPALISVDDPAETVREMTRAREIGLSGALLPVAPRDGQGYGRPEYEPIWACAADLALPITFHVGTHLSALRGGGTVGATSYGSAQSTQLVSDSYIKLAIGDLIFSGVFERHPTLKVVAAEFQLAWIPYYLQKMDYSYTQVPPRDGWYRFASGVVPSDFWYQNCMATFQDDPTVSRHGQWATIDVDTIMWGSDYPHFESTYPHSREIVGQVLGGLPPATKRKIAFENVSKLYGFDL
jgi:predicted TIM-barrel fold metal-dependent hydrolase